MLSIWLTPPPADTNLLIAISITVIYGSLRQIIFHGLLSLYPPSLSPPPSLSLPPSLPLSLPFPPSLSLSVNRMLALSLSLRCIYVF